MCVCVRACVCCEVFCICFVVEANLADYETQQNKPQPQHTATLSRPAARSGWPAAHYRHSIAIHYDDYEHLRHAPSTSKSSTISFVSSVPLREPTAQISFVSFALNTSETPSEISELTKPKNKNLKITVCATRHHQSRPSPAPPGSE